MAISDNQRTNWIITGGLVGASSTYPGTTIFHIFNYRDTNFKRTALAIYGQTYTGTLGESAFGAYNFDSTQAINRLDIGRTAANFLAGTTATLYGVKAA